VKTSSPCASVRWAETENNSIRKIYPKGKFLTL
jgi:hypothetical protein